MSITVESINAFLDDFDAHGVFPRCHSVSPASATAVVAARPEVIRPGGYINGPAQFGAADAALYFLAFGALDRIEPMALTSELSIRYLRPAVGGVVFARARLDRLGRRTMVGTVSVWVDDQEDRPSATAQGTYMMP